MREFKSLRNIESSFRQIRLFALVFLGLCTAVSVCCVWKAYDFAERQREKIYVLDQGKSLIVALSQDLSQNRPVEAREHVRRFHELFFTLAPEKSAIESNITRALALADRSAMTYYKKSCGERIFQPVDRSQHFSDDRSGQHSSRLRAISLQSENICPAGHSARKHDHRAQFGDYLRINQLRPFGKQSAGLFARKSEHRREQRLGKL